MKRCRGSVPHGTVSGAGSAVAQIATSALAFVAAIGFSVVAVAATGLPTTSDAIVLIDASRTGKPAIVYATAELALNRSSAIGFARLSPPVSTALECCARVTRATSPSRDLQSRLVGAESASRFTTAQLTKRPLVPFIGVGFVGATAQTAQIVRENEHSFLLKRGAANADVRVQHCVSGETFHLRAIDVVTLQERRRYSLPLGMDVEADCTEQIMPTLKN